jgi:4'-phosphopantetheinyl transferase EntD
LKRAATVVSPSPLLAGLLPHHAVSAEIRGFRGAVCVAAQDEANVRNASPKRRDEFAAGRLCAAAALQALGSHSLRVDREEGGAPIWPPGVCGSISHNDDVAAAVVCRAEEVRAIGVDIEKVGSVEPVLWTMLFSEAEHRQLAAADPRTQDVLATTMFTAKEAFYKAQWPITREWLDFLDVEIEVSGCAFAVLPRQRRSWTWRLDESQSGLFAVTGDTVAAIVLAPPI